MLKKRFASFALCIAMLLSMSVTVFAAESTQTRDPLADIPRAEIYRDVVSAFYEADGSQVQPRWTSGDSENNYGSHGLIALMGIVIASGKNAAIDDYFTSTRTQWLIEYSVMPDIDEKGLLYDCHFYGANEKNYSGGTDTAYTRFRDHYNAAVVQYRSGNYLQATQELGRAIHFISDINNPHHASNSIAGVSYHTQFEDYVEEARENNVVNPTYVTATYLSSFSNKSLKTIADESAVHARGYFNQANATWPTGFNRSQAVLAINPTFCNAQKVTAGVIYKFCDEVGMF